MEQNQSQAQANPQQLLWQAARNEFAPEGEAIGQTQDVAALVLKWVWIQHEEEFKQHERTLREEGGGRFTLEDLVKELILAEKEESWLINQRYTMDQVNQIIRKLRQRVQDVLQTMPNPNPEAESSPPPPQDKEDGKEEGEEPHATSKQTLAYSSSLLPEIKPKGRLYNPQDMHSSFHLLKQTEQEYKIHSPAMFSTENKARQKQMRQKLLGNKYLRQTFKWLAKQGYNYKGLFQDFTNQGDRMTLNKWMVFCKEFDFIDKIPKKDLVSIFQTATKFTSNMFIDDFLTAVALLQDKYVSRFHKGEHNFVAEVLQIDSQAAFKVKMDNLKINYSGPRKNFFEYGTYSEHQRAEELQREKQFQVKRREREVVLIKGMFEDHLKDEVRQLKANREKLKATRLGNSLNMIQIKEKSKERELKEVPCKTARLQDLNYSKLFQINRSMAVQPNTTTSNTHMYKTQLVRNDPKPHKIEHRRIDADNRKYQDQRKLDSKSHHQRPQPVSIDQINKQKQNMVETPPERTWLTNVRSDSEQSDDILKEHLQFQRRVKETKVEALMREMREKSKNVDLIHEEMKQLEEEDPDMAETQINFKQVAT